MAGVHIEKLQEDKSHPQGNAGLRAKQGCVTKCVGSDFKKHHGSYRQNGYDDTKGNPRKKAYYKPDLRGFRKVALMVFERTLGSSGLKHRPKNPKTHDGAWDFEGENYQNANKPYAHNYHHLVPWEALKKSLVQKELKALQQSGYNLNDGMNMLILPCFRQVAELLGMFTHPNNHPTYNIELVNAINEVKFCLTGDDEAHLEEEDLPNLKAALEAWEKAAWFKIQIAGQAADATHVDNFEPSSMLDALISA